MCVTIDHIPRLAPCDLKRCLPHANPLEFFTAAKVVAVLLKIPMLTTVEPFYDRAAHAVDERQAKKFNKT